MIKRRLLYMALLVGSLIFSVFYYGWFSWFLPMLAICAPVISIIPAIAARGATRVTMSVPQRTERGNTEQLVITVSSANGIMPPCVMVELEIENGATGEWERERFELSCMMKNTMEISTEHCEIIRCRVVRCRVFDHLRLFALPVKAPAAVSMTVMPLPKEPQPVPDLSRFQQVSYRTKPSGGFAEVYEFREFRPGDSMRDIHWKLSAKTDRLIVREPQQPERGTVIITCDIASDAQRADELLDKVAWVSQWLLQNNAEHDIRWQASEAAAPISVTVSSEETMLKALEQLIKACSKAESDVSFASRVPTTAWHYHVGVGVQEQ